MVSSNHSFAHARSAQEWTSSVLTCSALLLREDRNRKGGSGDSSLRRVSRVKHVLSFQERTNDTEPEDEFLSNRLALLPDANVAKPGDNDRFVISKHWAEAPLAFSMKDWRRARHDMWDNDIKRQAVWNYCPELKIILPMKLERERCAEGDNKNR